MTVYRVTDKDGENAREIDAWFPRIAAEKYAEMWHDDSSESPDGEVFVVDGVRYMITVEWDPVYYATEVKP